MEVGLMVPTVLSVEVNEMALQAAEAFGMDSVWLPDHLLGPYHPGLWQELPAAASVPDPDGFLDPFCIAAILGRQTAMSVGTCVTDATRRRGADLARAALTLQRCCRGDFILGIGSGEAESLLPFGYPFVRPVGLLEEALSQIRSLLDTGAMPDGGLGRTGLSVAEYGTPKIWVAANGPRSLRLTGTYADGWLPVGGIGAEEYARQRSTIAAAAEHADRPQPVSSLFPITILGESRDHVAELFECNPMAKAILLVAPATLWARYGLDHPGGPSCRGFPDIIPHALDPRTIKEALRQVPREMAEEYLLTGNAIEIAQQLRPYQDAGLEHLVLCDITGLTYDAATTQSLMPEFGALRQLLQAEEAVR